MRSFWNTLFKLNIFIIFMMSTQLCNKLSLLTDLKKEDLSQIAMCINQSVSVTTVKDVTTCIEHHSHHPSYKTSYKNPRKISIKFENETPSKSFKIRGAFYYLKFLQNQYPNQALNLFSASTGNYGISLALFAKEFGYSLSVVVPTLTPLHKQQKILNHAAQLICSGEFLEDAYKYAQELADIQGGIFLDSLNPLVIMGHTSLGYELFNQVEPIDDLFFPMGIGSGMLALAIARKQLSPHTRLIGVVPELCPTWIESRKQGRPLFFEPQNTIAEGLRAAQPHEAIFQLLNEYVDEMMTVSEYEISEAQKFYQDQVGVSCEPTGAVGFAGLTKVMKTGRLSGRHVATVLCGAN